MNEDKMMKAADKMMRAACMLTRAMGMFFENVKRTESGESVAYDEVSFSDLLDEYKDE